MVHCIRDDGKLIKDYNSAVYYSRLAMFSVGFVHAARRGLNLEDEIFIKNVSGIVFDEFGGGVWLAVLLPAIEIRLH